MSDLESFSLDPGNRVAAVAARTVADASGVPYAPLVIVGSRGSGKTELLRAIVQRLLVQHPRASVELLDPAALADRYRSALLAGEEEAFRAVLAGADLVLFDDLDRLAEQRESQGLVADLLDQRRAAGREVVVAVASPVAQLGGLDPRLARRLSEGTTVQLGLPGQEARVAILERRLAQLPQRVSSEVVRTLASVRFAALRDYTGALSRLIAFQEASPVPLSPHDALLLLGIESDRPVAGVSGVSEVGGVSEVSEVSGWSGVTSPTSLTSPSHEFEAFLSDVSATVSEQIDRWRRRIGEAVLRYGGEGFRTRRLELLLEQEAPADPEAVLAAYESDAEEMRALARQAGAVAPDLAGAEVFRDPDQLAAARELLVQARSGAAPLSAPLPEFRWEDLVEGPGERLMMLAGRDIIAEPGRRYSPLLVVGRDGAGKSHYLHALGNALAARGIGPVACLGAPAFAAELRDLIDADSLTAWRQRYRWVGAFLLDDLHLLADDHRAQRELAALVGELLEGQRQMVFASLRPLEELAGFEPHLVSGLSSGLLVELAPPDREVRLVIVKRLLADSSAADDAALADYLSSRPAQSIREVQALVRRVKSAALSQQVAPSPALAREVLEEMPRAGGPAGGGAKAGTRRSSGILSPGLGLVRSKEKMVASWPEVADRLIAELR